MLSTFQINIKKDFDKVRNVEIFKTTASSHDNVICKHLGLIMNCVYFIIIIGDD